jgi:Tol biopolymer transport system component
MRSVRTIARALAVIAWIVAAAPASQATFPGDDGLIAYSYESPVPGEHLTQADIYTMEPGGTGILQLTATPHRNEFAPAWNADGTKIAFWRTKAPFGPGTIWVMDADGSNRVRLTSDIDARDPVWSPNGRRIAFSSWTKTGSMSIYTMRASDGDGRVRVTPWPSLEFEPAWSPDGSTIAFTRGFERGDVGDIWTIDLVTGHAAKVTSTPGYDHQVAWFADGSRLAFERVGTLVAAKIVTVEPDGDAPLSLTTGYFDADPAPSPAGTTIVFASDRIGGFLPDLWAMGSDGSAPHVVVDLPFASTTPDWQPIPVPGRAGA